MSPPREDLLSAGAAQAPKVKHQIPNEFQAPNDKQHQISSTQRLEFELWDLEFVCDL
jgi:hypothetical protein